MKQILRILILILPIIFSSCFFMRIGIRSLGDTFSSPEEIHNKIKYPVKDNVKLSALWVGHSTMLVQIYDKVIITDPFFTDKLGGLLMRKKEAGLDIQDIPGLDLILVSHSHMDHMSYGSLQMLADRFPGTKMLFPAGDENYLPDFDLNMIMVKTSKYWKREYTAEPVYIDSMKITPVYAYHPGGRYLIDTYSWKTPGATGFIVQFKDVCIYFAGDTGYDEYAFKQIGSKFNIDLAFIPIGPCHNCDSSGIRYHASTVEALQILQDLNAKYMMPIHYGALTYFGDPDHPKDVLEEILSDSESPYFYLKDRVKIINDGEQIVFMEK
jgi:N-acyl-phosphatidylethanolamine-hydrolysing phospholipase D